MKTVILSVSLLLSVPQLIYAVPSDLGVRAANGEKRSTYLVLLKEKEKRDWDKILPELGFKTTGKTEHVHSSKGESGLDYKSYVYKSSDGADITAFGATVRAFSKDMTADEKDRISKSALVDIMELDGLEGAKAGEARKAAEKAKKEKGKREVMRFKRAAAAPVKQTAAPWHLARISQKGAIKKEGEKPYQPQPGYTYRYDGLAGEGVDIYVIDSGVDIKNPALSAKATSMFTAYEKDHQDYAGHGTHVSGAIASQDFGVAKKSNIIDVKIINKDNIPISVGLMGFDFAYARHLQRKSQSGFKGSVINSSLGSASFGPSLIFRRLWAASFKDGMHIIMAAGNAGEDACYDLPEALSQSMPLITVGASDINDAGANFSNYGPCVSIYAPGVNILSPYQGKVAFLNGTSMATPQVAGMVAIELGKNPKLQLDPKGMKKLLLSKALKGMVKEPRSKAAPVLLYNGLDA
ncbi:hypothetical protein H072_7403 [Dactylellina haptotyla CBS 200.50]|uniref:Peptidase S8/S53 domain-containing protein n=1 Tax=Dactylellina haptotyla (strain CBS 200.50) TaxID=1284197 RepID=S8BU58_DACHA|nr:hypothetical protein H072_7403 [Dactylellina haptotyla CBS 200.50]